MPAKINGTSLINYANDKVEYTEELNCKSLIP
jgi:hypothetical protein